MDGHSKTDNAGDRRGTDRRVKQRAFEGTDKRVSERRSGQDRRAKPRYSSPISEQS